MLCSSWSVDQPAVALARHETRARDRAVARSASFETDSFEFVILLEARAQVRGMTRDHRRWPQMRTVTLKPFTADGSPDPLRLRARRELGLRAHASH
jgi:hypothetical protein